MSKPTIRVFISYAWESDDFKDSIWNLAGWLLNNSGGDIQVMMDRYFENRPPEKGWQIWMQNEIDIADVVLIVCSPLYRQRFQRLDDNEIGGAGVTFEGAIITQGLYNAKLRNNKFFPILPDNGSITDIPTILQSYNNNHTFPNGNERILKLIYNDNPSHLTDITKAISDIPAETKNGELEKTIVEEIIEEIKEQEKNNEKTMLTPIQIIVRTFLSLSENSKIDISKKLDIFDASFNTMNPNDRDKAIFKLIKDQNLLHALWEQINLISPFENNTNPFNKKENELHS